MANKTYRFKVEITFDGEGSNKDECYSNGVSELDMYSVESLFYKGDTRIKESKRVK